MRVGLRQASREVKRQEQGLLDCLHSVHQDARFVEEMRQLYPRQPLLANLRCGLWYSPRFDATSYFKSTDGHTGALSSSQGRSVVLSCTPLVASLSDVVRLPTPCTRRR